MDHLINTHITTWFLAIILFLVAIRLYKNEKYKPEKVVLMILRLFYIFIMVTGTVLLFHVASMSFGYVFKVLAGVWVIGMLEMILARTHSGKNTTPFWVLFLVSFLAVLYMGYSLPLGNLFF